MENGMNAPPVPSEYVPCPKCQSTNVQKQSFTWWGGVLGPKLLSHVKCQNCGATFNGKTGGSNTAAITIYIVVVCILAAGIMIALRS